MRTKVLAHAIVLLVAISAVACNESGNTTIVNQGLDCGLIRDNLVGNWAVDLGPVTPSLQNCTGLDPGLNGTLVGTDDFPATYSPMDVFGSDGSTSFKLLADRSDSGADATQPVELTGSVQADSCLAIVRVWSQTDVLYFQCIGSFTISNQTLSGACDSAEIDSDTDGQLDTSCSLSNHVSFNASIN
jgi:hypothetical protein